MLQPQGHLDYTPTGDPEPKDPPPLCLDVRPSNYETVNVCFFMPLISDSKFLTQLPQDIDKK